MKSNKRSITALTVATGMLISLGSANAAVVMSVINTDDDSTFQDPALLELDFLLGGSTATPGSNERDIDSNRSNAQSFTVASNFTLDKIAINYQSLNATGINTTFEFFRVADANAGTLTVDGSILESFTFNGSNAAFSGATTNGTLVFDITDIAVETGDTFAIRFITGGGEHSIKWRYFDASTDSYAGGDAYESNSAANAQVSGKVYSFGLVAAIPEPSTALLGGLGLLALLRRRR